jgi:hypothetical protein
LAVVGEVWTNREVSAYLILKCRKTDPETTPSVNVSVENSGSVEDDEHVAPATRPDQSIGDQSNTRQTPAISGLASQLTG